jgi:hypothetical protein
MRAKTKTWLLGLLIVGGVAAGAYAWLGPEGQGDDQPTWEHTYGGSGRDEANRAAPTADGGTVVAGDRSEPGKAGRQAWVIRLDAHGKTVWERTWGGTGDQRVEDIQAAEDGTFVVAGETQAGALGVGHRWVAKLDPQGEVAWRHDYGGQRVGSAHSILVTADGGYVAAGMEQAAWPGRDRGWVAKIDALGAVVWERTYGDGSDERIQALRDTPDGGYVFVGSTRLKPTAAPLAWVVKVNAIGEPLWQRTFGGPTRHRALDVVTLGDEGFVVAGWSERPGRRERRDGWVLRLDAKGDKLWEHTYGGGEDDAASEIRPANTGGFVVVGSTASAGAGRSDAWIFRIDAEGRLLWERTLGGAADDAASAVVPMVDGAFVVAGSERSEGAGQSDAWVLRVNALGQLAQSH